MKYLLNAGNFSLTVTSEGVLTNLSKNGGVNLVAPTPFAVLIKGDKTESLPCALSVINQDIKILFDCGISIKTTYKSYADFLTFTLKESSTKNFHSVKFVNALSNIDYDSSSVALSLMAMTMATRMHEHPGLNTKLIAEAFTKIGLFGNDRSPYNPACAVICCDKDNLIKVQRQVLSLIPDGELIKSPVGGPYAKNALASAKKTYSLHWTPITEDNYDQMVKYFKNAGIEQINLHHALQYVQGSFTVNEKYYPNGISDYKKIVDRLHGDGFEVALHPYSFFIDPKDKLITPIPNDDIDVLDEFTLNCDLSIDGDEIITKERLDGVEPTVYYVTLSSNTLRIDDEIIKFSAVDSSGKFYNLERGALGTKKSSHLKGAKIKRLKQYFYNYLAKAGSKLFYQIAKNTADFYNEVGFDAVYFDALDGVGALDDEDYAFYHAVDFIREFYKYVKKPPIFNCCHNLQYTGTWYARSRYGALDRPKCAYIDYVDAHLLYNKEVARRMGVNEELGWLDLCPDCGRDKYYYQFIPIRKEDVCYLYAKCMATDACVAYLESLPEKQKIPAVIEHQKTVVELQNYIKSHALSENSKKYLSQNRSYVIFENDKLKKASFDRYYFEHTDTTYKITNNFYKQKPFIRIENLYTTSSYDSDGIILTDSATLSDGEKLKVKFTTPINAEFNRGLSVKVKGDGGGGILSVYLKSYNGNAPKYINFYIKNDFVGEKEFSKVEVQTGEFDSIPPKEMDNSTYTTLQEFYGYYFGVVDFKNIAEIGAIYNGEGIVKLSPIKLLKVVQTEVKNLEIKIGDKAIKTNISLKSSECLEIERNGSARVIDSYFNEVCAPFTISEMPIVENGNNLISVKGESELLPRLKVTIGLVGEQLD